jgi:hypothetical protein
MKKFTLDHVNNIRVMRRSSSRIFSLLQRQGKPICAFLFFRAKAYTFVFVFALSLLLLGCGDKPMTEADMAKNYGLSLEEYQEQKEAAARMNMNVEDHLNMESGDMDHEGMGH